ncbi:MAG: DEAD/DEAH box helicase, partial [Arenimonas sp.]
MPRSDGRALGQRLQAKYRERITGSILLPARAARYAPLPRELPPALAAALKARGVEQLYSHQAEAWQLAREGRDMVVATPTASGKSLCYTLP